MRIAAGGLLAAVLFVSSAALSHAQESAGCTLEGKVYHCSWSAFQASFRTATTVAIEGRDHHADRQLREFAREMNKTVVPGPAQGADLTLTVMSANTGGIFIGPSDTALATLYVYGRSNGTDRGPLLWSETLTGQGDMPWPSQVHMLLAQFKERFASKH